MLLFACLLIVHAVAAHDLVDLVEVDPVRNAKRDGGAANASAYFFSTAGESFSGSTVISTKNTRIAGRQLALNADELGGEQRAGIRAAGEDERDHRDLAAQVAQREALAVLVGERERRGGADLGQRFGARRFAR